MIANSNDTLKSLQDLLPCVPARRSSDEQPSARKRLPRLSHLGAPPELPSAEYRRKSPSLRITFPQGILGKRVSDRCVSEIDFVSDK